MDKIKMLKTVPGSYDGLHVLLYEKDRVYPTERFPMSDELKKIFLDNKFAEEYVPAPEVLKRMEKMADKAPENKAVSGAPSNKAAKAPPSDKPVSVEFFSDMKAGQIRAYAAKKGIDLTDLPANTSANALAKAFVERQ